MSKVSKIEAQPTEIEHITRIYAWEAPAYEHINYWLKLKGASFRYKSRDGEVYPQLYAFLKKNREQIAQELADEAGINFSFKEFEWMLEQKGGRVMKKGNFEAALQCLLGMLKDSADKGNRDCQDALRKWDSIRGTDWYRKED